MTDICRFNVGGHKYQVSRYLLKQHPNTMLARISSEQWQKDPKAEIFVDRNGDRFQYCLDYLRDGFVSIPVTVPKKALLQDFAYYGVEGVDEASIDDGPVERLYWGRAIKKSTEMLAQMERERECLEVAAILFRLYGESESEMVIVRKNDKYYSVVEDVIYSSPHRESLIECLGRLGLEFVVCLSRGRGYYEIHLKVAHS
mmetsp:Transcript_37935/g.57745  ORF Transcript_37935/g.57745 Transcript_37935/m.57745 type:complete len:200 (+) Transcript_37935:604-1203(+)